jgi:hypothetical protein
MVEEGLLYFVLSKSSSLFKAYIESKNIINDYFNGNEKFEKIYIESSISSKIFEIVSNEKTLLDSCNENFINFSIFNQKKYFNQSLIDVISNVSKDDLENNLFYLHNLFNESLSNSVVTTNSSKINELTDEFSDIRNFLEIDFEKFFI